MLSKVYTVKMRKICFTEIKLYFLFYILCEIEIQRITATIDYCKLPCLINNTMVEHVICTLENDCSVGPECKVRTKFKLTREMKTSILNIHNLYRNKVALGEAIGMNGVNLPQGADLLEMVWDDELAYFAQCYANKCILQYDKCRQNSARENIDQIIFIRMTVNPKTPDEVIMEMIETVFYSSKYLSEGEIEVHMDNKFAKQFTQLFWSRTNRVGCGVTKLLEDLYAYFMVCNYGTAGNIEGEKVYEIGLPCSSCPDQRICGERYNGLCTAEREATNSLESIPAFLTTLERIVDPSLQKDEINTNFSVDGNNNFTTTKDTVSDKYSIYNEERRSNDFGVEMNVENNRNVNAISDSSEMNTAGISATTSETREIAVRLCKVKRKNGWKSFNRQTAATSSGIDLLNTRNVHMILTNLLLIIWFRFLQHKRFMLL